MLLSSYGERASFIGFLALFPGLYFYNLLAGFGVIPLFLGGWWGAITGFVAVAVFPALILETLSKHEVKPHLAFFTLSIFVLAYAAYFRVLGSGWASSNTALIESGALLVAWAALYGIGYFWSVSTIQFRVVVTAWGAMCAISIVLMDPQSLSFIGIERFGNSSLADYQWWATGVVFSAIVVLAYGGPRTQAVVVATTLLTLFLMSSRSEFYGMIAISLLWLARAVWLRDFKLAALGVCLTFCAFILTILAAWVAQHLQTEVLGGSVSSPVAGWGGNFRQAEALKLMESQSGSLRLHYLMSGLADIMNSPLLGAYASNMKNGEVGGHIHNGLEMWRQYGLFPLILFAGLSIHAVWVSVRVWRGRDDASIAFIAYIAIFTLGLSVATKSIGWPLPALAWGLAAGLQRSLIIFTKAHPTDHIAVAT